MLHRTLEHRTLVSTILKNQRNSKSMLWFGRREQLEAAVHVRERLEVPSDSRLGERHLPPTTVSSGVSRPRFQKPIWTTESVSQEPRNAARLNDRYLLRLDTRLNNHSLF